jgi:hypothetical protein
VKRFEQWLDIDDGTNHLTVKDTTTSVTVWACKKITDGTSDPVDTDSIYLWNAC